MFPNYYKRLGVDKNATRSDIKKAFRSLAIKYHPDKNKSSNAHNQFVDVNEAYTILYDKQARAKYDREYYNHFYGDKKQNTTSRRHANHPFDDKDLNRKAKRAKAQAATYAKMAFKQFSRLLIGIAVETVWFVFSIITGALGVFAMLFGASSIISGLFSTNNLISIISGLAIFLIGFLFTGYSDRYDKMIQQRYNLLLILGIILLLFGIGHITLNLFSDQQIGGLTLGIMLLPIGLFIVGYGGYKRRRL